MMVFLPTMRGAVIRYAPLGTRNLACDPVSPVTFHVLLMAAWTVVVSSVVLASSVPLHATVNSSRNAASRESRLERLMVAPGG